MRPLMSIAEIMDEMGIGTQKQYNTHFQYSTDELKRTIIVLYRIQPELRYHFEGFYSFLEKISKLPQFQDIFPAFMDFMNNSNNDIWHSLNNYLDAADYPRRERKFMHLAPKEKSLMDKLPNKRNLLYMLILYLFQPLLAYNFFLDNPHLLGKELLVSFNELEKEYRAKIGEYVRCFALHHGFNIKHA